MKFLRAASWEDAELLFSWANDREVRANSFSQAEISYEEHKEWYSRLLQQEKVRQYIYMQDDEPVGQVRIEVSEDRAVIGYSVSPLKRGMGHGKRMIELLEKQVREDFPEVKQLVAKVKPENAASERVFEATGYKEAYRVFEKELGDAVY